ncbi:MAG: hypothetical protein HY342_11755 [Candidatus Lambdaproteobacteria bacterium]|nr:hypothetical protein [Candidatus Lambdaproteobacteria bacterium]
MASNDAPGGTTQMGALLQRKIDLAREMLGVTARELLLVSLDGLEDLLMRKDGLIVQMRAIDGQLGGRPPQTKAEQALLDEYATLVRSILENEHMFEERLQEEQERLRGEMRAFEQQTRLRKYLDADRPKGRSVDVKK